MILSFKKKKKAAIEVTLLLLRHVSLRKTNLQTKSLGFRTARRDVLGKENENGPPRSHAPLLSIGTHYFRGINNLQQPWNSWTGRRKHELKPNNPTEEGLASIHSVLFRKDPFLWRAALLYYTVYQAGQMSFCELFEDIGRFVKDPNTRWDYCVRAKRGWTDTSQPGGCPLSEVF